MSSCEGCDGTIEPAIVRIIICNFEPCQAESEIFLYFRMKPSVYGLPYKEKLELTVTSLFLYSNPTIT